MRKILLLTLIFPFLTLSQSKNDSAIVNSLREGWSFQLQLGGIVNAAMFEKMTFSVKRQFDEKLSLRLGSTVDLGMGKQEETISYAITPTSKSKNIDGIVFLNVLFHFNTQSSLTHYIGIGPLFGYSEFKSENITYDANNQIVNSFHYNSKNIYGGAMAVIGLEWFMHKKIALLAEYNLLMKFGSLRTTSTQVWPLYTDIRNENRKFNQLQGDVAKIGISFYF